MFLQTLVSDGLDMVSGRRIAVGGNAYRTGHVIGNWLLNRATVMIFRQLHTWRDGLRIVFAIARLVREERPLVFFAAICALLILLSLILGVPVVLEYLKTGLVPRLPTAVLSMGLMLLAFLSLASGLILDTVTRGRWELKRLAYLAVSGPHDLRLP